ncbi:MAG: hypothetical protein C5S47_00895 [Candidatus Methanogasteraceae archaeon]|nr:MAG: hypothetical protein C5S47_00895 [ANME-2 cluster archaeon]
MRERVGTAQPKIPVKYTRGLLFFAPSRLCVFALLFFNLTQGRKGAETRRVLSIAVFTSFVLLYIQLTIDGNHWISRQCQKLLEYG